jgi:hypothetical protein
MLKLPHCWSLLNVNSLVGMRYEDMDWSFLCARFHGKEVFTTDFNLLGNIVIHA